VVVGAAVTGTVPWGVVVATAVGGVVTAGAVGSGGGAAGAGTPGGSATAGGGLGPIVGAACSVGGASVADPSDGGSAPDVVGPRRRPGRVVAPCVSPAVAGGPTDVASSDEGSLGRVAAGAAGIEPGPRERAADGSATIVVLAANVGDGSGTDRPDSGPRHTASSVNKVTSSPATTHRPIVRREGPRPARRGV
jgi:hypothetical protein